VNLSLRSVSSARYSAVALTALLTLSVPVAAAQKQAVHIDNFAKVSATYYRGAQPVGQDYADLASLGVKTVINLTSDDAQPNERAMVERNHMKYVGIPMTTHAAPSQAELEGFMAIVNDPAMQPVYVHCVGGRHRTGVMTAVYRMVDDGISGADAFREMKQFKYGADFLHPEFKDFVQHFDAKAFAAASAAAKSAK
jgi:protein tyrosine/serine phosphatase